MGTNGTSQETSNDQSVSNSFNITSADGSTLPIPAGEYYFNTKARPRRMMKNSLSNTARRVYACLELMTMGWKQELAVVSKDVNATREDISERTGIAVQHVSAALAELQAQGLGECRESTADKRKVEIYSWATPRAVEVPDTNVATFVIPEWVPEAKYLRSFLRRSRKKTYANLDHLNETSRRSYLDELNKTAREMEKAELRMSRLLDPNVADPDIYKEDRTDRNIERTVSQSVSSVLEVTTEDRPTDSACEDLPPPIPTPSVSEVPGGGSERIGLNPVAVDPQYAGVFGCIPFELFDKLQDLPTPQLLATIHRNLDGAPPLALTQKIRQRWNSITSLGLLANLAADVGKAYRQVIDTLQAKLQQSDQQLRQDRIRNLRELIRSLEDPYLPKEYPDLYRQIREDLANSPADELAEARGTISILQ